MQALNIKEVKQYDPAKVEETMYQTWTEKGYFKPEYNKKNKKEDRFTIILPPPNANASLHLGHASGYTYQDLMGRYNRMLGKETLLLPGKDHAGIQTEVVFEKELEKKGIEKRNLDRNEFYKMCYEFSMMNAANARAQEQRLGLSADYTRELFTLDPRIQKTVFETFVQMYNDGLIYRGKRIINWCVRCQTALSDIDTESRNEDTKLYYIKTGPFVLATTRPETKISFADTAIAVNPKDKRYKKYIGTKVTVTSVEGSEEIPVIADETIDMTFGTGVMKVTPGHSFEDFRLGQKYNLPAKTIIDFNGRMAANTGKYAGMKIMEAREAYVKDLQEQGLLEKVEDYNHNIKVCERCKSVIEPLISYQWFIKMDGLKADAITSVEKDDVYFHPKRQKANFVRWLSIPEDWCISRQLWWGYRIPAWYCGGKKQEIDAHGNVIETYGQKDGCGKIIVSVDDPKKCPYCGKTNLVQDDDVLDTWYSSGQWPYATLLAHSDDFERFFPTQVMETGRDIIFFWVARMVMLSLYKFKEVPFRDVYLHGIVLDKEGKKQSKSKGNGVDPMEMITKYGADALRFSFVAGNGPDQDYRLYEEKIKGFRNFINKIWNASRFIILQAENASLEEVQKTLKTETLTSLLSTDTGLQEIFDLHQEHIKKVKEHMNTFRFGKAADEIFNYFWHRLCDIDLETIKQKAKDEPKKAAKLIAFLLLILIEELQIMHPFIPFITEYLWQIMQEAGLNPNQEETILYSKYPE